jgi:hypothetical protein
MPNEDAGLVTLATVRDVLEPEPARIAEAPRGFAWWPHEHAMRVWAGPVRADGAVVVVAETALLGGVPGRGPEFAKLAERNAREPGLSALRWDSQSGEVSLRAAVIARPGDSGAAARLLSHAALLQVGEGLLAADALLAALPGATPLTPPPPVAGLGVVEQAEAWRAYAAGAPGRADALASALGLLATLSPAPWERVTRAAHGLDAEISCEPAEGRGGAGAGKALLRVSASQPHPRLGAGLVLVLVPPPGTEPVAERAYATAALLNEAEAREWTGVDQLGGWCVHPAVGLAHVQFLPALAVEDGTAGALAWQAALRARWATAFLAGVGALRVTGRGAGPGA